MLRLANPSIIPMKLTTGIAPFSSRFWRCIDWITASTFISLCFLINVQNQNSSTVGCRQIQINYLPVISHSPTDIPKKEPTQNPKKNSIGKIVLLENDSTRETNSIIPPKYKFAKK